MSKPSTNDGWRALNPAIYLISLLPGVLVFVLQEGRLEHPLAFVMAVLGVCFIQHAINVLNDYTDWKRGADVEKYDSWVIFHEGNLAKAKAHGFASLAVGILVGVASLFIVDKLWILFIALPLVLMGYFYNAGEKPLSYTPYAEWVTGLCYGPGVFGCLWLIESSLTTSGIAGTLAFAALSTSILFSHQPPQVLTDSLAGKLSFAVRFGAENAKLAAQVLLVVFFLAALISILLSTLPVPFKGIAFVAALYFVNKARGDRVSPKTVLARSSTWIAILAALSPFARVMS